MNRQVPIPLDLELYSLAYLRGPIVLTIDEAEYLLDQVPAPSTDEDEIVTKLRNKLSDLLTELRKGAEGINQ